MPLFMDVHTHIEGLTEDGLREAHRADLAVQDQFGVKYMSYWFDEASGKVFCLIEAPNADAANAVHRASHGLVADEINEVKEGT